MIESTVIDFRRHQLREKIFKFLRFYILNKKKNKILNRVADDFRRNRIESCRAYVTCLSKSVLETEDKILKQRVYTAWLQFTLDKFVKVKLLHKF